MLRPYFLFHRELLTELARSGYETVHELMAAPVDDDNVRVGMVVSIQTFSDSLKWNPHLHLPCYPSPSNPLSLYRPMRIASRAFELKGGRLQSLSSP